ncbi:Cytochrome c-552DMSO reductase-like, heme-binding domain containing protein [Heracleum sosnowskyi]|uniref:Cytochrome c-552DMSO reductase-like, heme-binding domain containing protein n=1 Tax=Heracleum sosnowskyi TaxID=360622 RepID=A0AAD8J7R6_9APIA|nr:Cytochrome c-552DMSO reductase-like, heme-binding domain containing protein [Heracleum sosnowskyi]
MMLMHFVLVFLASIFASTQPQLVNSHEEKGEWNCNSPSDIRVNAEFRPGIVTLDGHPRDWKNIDGFEFPLLIAVDPDPESEYNGGKMTVKALHDGHDVFFMLQVDGEYAYSKGKSTECPSVALMFQIGENASYHRMGGCKEGPDTCTRKSCQGHEVDIMHFLLGNAIPGRLYGGNLVDSPGYGGGDRFGHLVDVYAWNPHCRYLDGHGPSGNRSSAQNDWRGAWWHSSLTVHSGFVEEDSPYADANKKGTYYFEFSRPLRTMDYLQQDAQFAIGKPTKFSVAFWYPENTKPWHGSGHYSINCDWIPLDIVSGSTGPTGVPREPQRSSWNTATVFSFLFSLAAFSTSIFVGYRVDSSSKTIPFTPMENL